MPDNLVPAFSTLDISSTTNPPPYYKYAPLPSERSIRIIEILQESAAGLPQCSLSTISLDDKIPFMALSYTWGNSINGQEADNEEFAPQILCEGRVLDVTRNLYDFLKRAAPGQPDSWLTPEDRIWIDAICINQGDLNERSVQVRLMSELYQTANTVNVWLGEGESQEIQNAVELMKRLSATPEDELLVLKRLTIKDPRMKKVLGECGGSWDHWRALKNMCSRNWFNRVWIIQEVAFAKSKRVFCGGQHVSWDECVTACRFLDYSVANNMQMHDSGYFPGLNVQTLTKFTIPNKGDIWYVLCDSRNFESSDPRDKIFAIIGLAGLGPDRVPAKDLIRVDYELEPSKVFVDAVWAIMNHEKDLSFITLVEDRYWRRIQNIPTWTPDFSSTVNPKIYEQGLTYSAGRELTFALNRGEDSNLLNIEAYRLGEIPNSGNLSRNVAFLENCAKVLDILAELPPTYISGEDRLEVLWRTLIQNGFNWISPAPAEVVVCFQNWLLLNIAKAAAKDDNSVSLLELLEIVTNKCDEYSKNDSTGLMPSRQGIEVATAQMKGLNEGSYDIPLLKNLQSASKYRHEFSYYQEMYLFTTDNGLLGLGPPSLKPGDSLWIIPGVWLPMVFRSTDIEDRFEVMGPAYVHGIMYGEALDWDNLKCRSIVLQ